MSDISARRPRVNRLVGAAFIGVIITVMLAITILMNARKVPATPSPERDYGFYKTACWFDVDYQRDIVCGHLRAPAIGGDFLLPVVIIKDESVARRADPVIYLNGGPGVGQGLHKAGIERWLSWMRVADLKRDLILMDGRGLGRATPAVECALLEQFNRDLLGQALPLLEERQRNRTLVRECLTQLADANPVLASENFGTAAAADDVIGLMQSLAGIYGYEQFNLLAVSYGTRLALEVERANQKLPKSHLNALVLDSVYPPARGGIASIPQVAGDAFASFFHGCSQMPECREVLADAFDEATPVVIEHAFIAALAALNQRPMQLTLRANPDDAPSRFVLTDARFLAASFARSYSVSAWPDIARAIVAVVKGRESDLKLFVMQFLFGTFNPEYSELVFILNDCRDNGRGDSQAFAEGLTAYPWLAPYFVHELEQQTCQDFSGLKPLEPIKDLIAPTAVLAGEEDPITPIDWARQLHSETPKMRLIELPNKGHSILSDDLCWLQWVGIFMDAAGGIASPANVATQAQICWIKMQADEA